MKKLKENGIVVLVFFLLFFFQSKISESLTFSTNSYSSCIGQQGSLLSSANYKLLFTLNSPLGNSSSLNYRLNLGFISECIEGICCDFNSVCNTGETQENCPSDCKTEVKVIPSEAMSQEEVNVSISFSDSRYKHEVGTRIRIHLLLDDVDWDENCFSDIPIILRTKDDFQTCNWNYGNNLINCGNYDGNMTVQYDPVIHKVEIVGKCKLPALPAGYYVVNATVTFFIA